MTKSRTKEAPTDINPLAVPKGQSFVCEITGQPAKVMCRGCRLTFYRSHEEQDLDWRGIHKKICEHVATLRGKKKHFSSESERKEQIEVEKSLQRILVDICKNEARKHLVAQHYDLAIPAGVQALLYSKMLYGENSISVIPAYLLLAEANMGLDRHEMADRYLKFANWAILKNPNCSNELKSQFFRSFGKLYAHQQKHSEAIKELSKDVYLCSIEYGPEHLFTATGYYHMARNFFALGKMDEGLAFCEKILEIWHAFLEKASEPEGGSSISDFLTEAQIFEGEEILHNIYTTRQQALGIAHLATAKAGHTLGMMKMRTGQINEAAQLLEESLNVYQSQLKDKNDSLMLSILQMIDELKTMA
mmetsp:Transcript_20654/g.36683  ORF Transcript_20654/g.36683 Transcript_20654/m.36683 type:complete len:361 (+) Transcript_20654:123-1205(+)|eukprot:CAMPEP_0197530154 /NCGR_PEP_ID=MMETSP1318-20131121/30871_1 /TAXON_ID=552666 /ORGANISM="Partenskyella glossopodia, Strain RCC365" /LENGTH=360 /DNA_ID=CAMNT_0043085865 /DNA_START=37 /DNA_END=1119 /DNA_ORIENTATION=+